MMVRNHSEISGLLARPPQHFEVKNHAVCRLRVEVNGPGSPKRFNVIALGGLAEACDLALDQGHEVMVDGSLTWYRRARGEMGSEQGYELHEYVAIIADRVQVPGLGDDPVSLEVEPPDPVCFADLPAEMQELIMEKVVELTERDCTARQRKEPT